VGIFSKKTHKTMDYPQMAQQAAEDGSINGTAPDHSLPASNTNIDGILPAQTQTGHDPAQQNYTDFNSQSVPPVQDPPTEDEYIMTDPIPEPTPEVQQEPPQEQIQENAEGFQEPEPTTEQPPEQNYEHQQEEQHDNLDDLANLKQQALHQLSPLTEHLDQSPEEKFHTTMMMLQATDNHSLIKVAFESAKAIQDDKARAQALLDVINEINYFTQASNNSPQQ
jgi:hypothetical protein